MHTATSAATAIGCHRETVRRLARRYGLGQRVGTVVIFSEAEVKRLKKLVQAVGNPNFGKK